MNPTFMDFIEIGVFLMLLYYCYTNIKVSLSITNEDDEDGEDEDFDFDFDHSNHHILTAFKHPSLLDVQSNMVVDDNHSVQGFLEYATEEDEKRVAIITVTDRGTPGAVERGLLPALYTFILEVADGKSAEQFINESATVKALLKAGTRPFGPTCVVWAGGTIRLESCEVALDSFRGEAFDLTDEQVFQATM